MSSLRVLEMPIHYLNKKDETLTVDWEKHVGPLGGPGYVVKLISPPLQGQTDPKGLQPVANAEELYSICIPKGKGHAEEDKAIRFCLRKYREFRDEFEMEMNQWLRENAT